MDKQFTRLNIKFSGKDLPRGTIDVYDLANTVLASAKVVEGIARKSNFLDGKKIKIDVSALKSGSFDVDLILNIIGMVEVTRQTLFNLPNEIDQIKSILKILNGLLKIKKFLQGEKPSKVIIKQEGKEQEATIINFNGENMTVNMSIYDSFSDKHINMGLKGIFQPLGKEGGKVESIKLSSGNELKEEVSKSDYQYFSRVEEEIIEESEVRGVATAFDRKTGNGKITLQSEKRILFEIGTIHPDDYNKIEGVILDSLKLKTILIFKGKITKDSASGMKKIIIKDVKAEETLI
jgi:hypothetical protein